MEIIPHAPVFKIILDFHPIVDQSAQSALIAIKMKHVSDKNVKTRVPALAVTQLDAQCIIICQFVPVQRDIPAIPSTIVSFSHDHVSFDI